MSEGIRVLVDDQLLSSPLLDHYFAVGTAINALMELLVTRTDLSLHIESGLISIGYRGETPEDCEVRVGTRTLEPTEADWGCALRSGALLARRGST